MLVISSSALGQINSSGGGFYTEPVSDEQTKPIGVFDSGFGGLTVARALVDLMPGEDIIYLGDTKRAPYGPRPIAEVRQFGLWGLDYLVEQNVKALIIACNSASGAMLRDAREKYQVPITEVILPAAQRAVSATRNNRVGVICTEATAISRSYDDAFAAAPHITLTTKACPRFVDFVEAGITSGSELLTVAQEYLAPLMAAQVDTLILGCTHYPLLSGIISYVMGEAVTLVSSADECARATFIDLTRRELFNTEQRAVNRRFVTTGSAERFEGISRRLLGGFVSRVEPLSL